MTVDTSPVVRLGHDDVVAWAQSMVPRLAQRADEAERLRRLPDATIAECDEAGIWRLVIPPERGGYGLGLRSLCEMSRILAQGCMSTAWTVSFLTLHNWFVLRADEAVQAAVFGDAPFVRMATPLAPDGEALPVEGGYRLTGRWQWATGIMHSDWVAVMAFVPAGANGAGGPTPRVLLASVDDVEIVDVWHTSGMRATGSHDVAANDLFVPEDHTLSLDALRGDEPPGARLRPDVAFLRYPMSSVLTLYASATAVGGAEAAVAQFRDLVSGRVLSHSAGDRQVEQGTSQARLGSALATVRASRAVWSAAIDELCAAYDGGGSLARHERATFRLAAAHAVKLAREAVEICGVGAGAGQYFDGVAFQRIERDLATLKGHVVYDWDRVTQLAGRLELGFPPEPTDLL
jgi:3-hydroxy-9,10-secoandrosta-1,3,5(10)-triene-9,17-dione monooxygenase